MDEYEFEQPYRREWPVLVGRLELLCRDEAEAADCVQEAFVRAWQHRRGLGADAGGWLQTTAARVAVSRWRRRRTSAAAWLRLGAGRPDVVRTTEPPLDPASALVRGVMALPDRQREAVVLHHVMDMSVAQVADVLGVPDGTVKAWLSRGRRAVREHVSAQTSVAVAPTGEGWR